MAPKCCGLKVSLFGSPLCLVVAADVVMEVLFMHPYVQSRSDLCTTSCLQLLENFCISFSWANERDASAWKEHNLSSLVCKSSDKEEVGLWHSVGIQERTWSKERASDLENTCLQIVAWTVGNRRHLPPWCLAVRYGCSQYLGRKVFLSFYISLERSKFSLEEQRLKVKMSLRIL